jgi:hypothetical protein
MSRRYYTLGSNAQEAAIAQTAPQIGSAFGGQIGQGIGTIIQFGLQLFGGKTHTTPSGRTYHQATGTFRANQLAIQGLQSQYNAAHGLPPPNFPPMPTNGDSPAYYQWMSGWVAYYLNQPSLATSSAKQYDKLKAGGAFDAAINVQNSIMQQLAAGQSPGDLSGGGATATAGVSGGLDVSSLLLYGVGAIVLIKLLED